MELAKAIFTIHSFTIESRYRICAVATPGMTAAEAFQAHPPAPEGTVLRDGFDHVLRAGGRVATGVGQVRRQNALVYFDEKDQYCFHSIS